MRRRQYLAAIGTTTLAATAGCVSNIPVVGPLVSCGPGEVKIGNIRDGGFAGEQVTVTGKLNYTLTVGDEGIMAFRVTDGTGTIAVFLAEPPQQDLNFDDCLTVRGTVRAKDDRPETDGPIIEEASLQ